MTDPKARLMNLGFRCDRSVVHPRLGSEDLVRRDEVALHVVDHPIRVIFATGDRFELAPNRLMVSWGAMPHRPQWLHNNTVVYSLNIPLAWVLRWRLPASFNRTLLACQPMVEPDESEGEFDEHMLQRWTKLLVQPDDENRRIVLLEAEGRLRRFARDYRKPTRGHAAVTASSSKVEEAIQIIAKNFSAPLRLTDLADELGVHPHYLSTLFRRETGQTLSNYLAEFRLAHACALLVGTTDKILDVALAAGFGSACQFHALFRRSRNCSPRQYRLTHRQSPHPWAALS
jgi:AraC-like DNA-binding protein